jgi:hypothetical protein
VYSLEYTEIPKVFFTPHYVGRHTDVIGGHCSVAGHFYTNVIPGHCCVLGRACGNVIPNHCWAIMSSNNDPRLYFLQCYIMSHLHNGGNPGISLLRKSWLQQWEMHDANRRTDRQIWSVHKVFFAHAEGSLRWNISPRTSWRQSSIHSWIINLDTRGEWVVSFTLYLPKEKFLEPNGYRKEQSKKNTCWAFSMHLILRLPSTSQNNYKFLIHFGSKTIKVHM